MSCAIAIFVFCFRPSADTLPCILYLHARCTSTIFSLLISSRIKRTPLIPDSGIILILGDPTPTFLGYTVYYDLS